MRKISANYIIPVSGLPLKNGIVEVDDEGVILNVIKNSGTYELANVEFYNGVIVPGFVNAHCHLELSCLKNKIAKSAGMTSFIQKVVEKRNECLKDEIVGEIEKVDDRMNNNGIVAAGDILNTSDTFDIKKKSKIQYYNFIEVLGLNQDRNEEYINEAKKIQELFESKASITAHSFYSLNRELIHTIFNLSKKNKWPVSIHFKESNDEEMLIRYQKGALYKFLTARKKGDVLWRMSLEQILKEINELKEITKPILLIHNIYARETDIETVKRYIKNPFWIFCPGSNLFIENRLPDIHLFRRKQQKIALGTDSLASNNTLDILEEIKCIYKRSQNIPFEEILLWATLNGAEALGIEDKKGSIEKGKQPGLNLINKFDFVNFAPSQNSKIKVLI